MVQKVNERRFVEANWHDFYDNVKEKMPPQMPEPRGKSAVMSMIVDADHARNLLTRRSHTSIFLYVNNAPINWLSKQTVYY